MAEKHRFEVGMGLEKKSDLLDEAAEARPEEVAAAKKQKVTKKVREELGKHDPANPKAFKYVELPSAPEGVRWYLHKGKLLDIKGRLGDGPCTLLASKLMMPNGDYAEKGDTFDPAYEGFNYAQYRHLVKSKVVKASPAAEAAYEKLKK